MNEDISIFELMSERVMGRDGECVGQRSVCLYLMLFMLFSLVIAGLFERPCLQSLETQRSSE